MVETKRCSVAGCERSADAVLEMRPFCREHFISTCYARLEACTESLGERPFHDTSAESIQQFVHECVWQVNKLAQTSKELDNLERARLLDILFWSSELGRRLRKSPREVAALPIRLRSEELGHPWEEDTETQLLSRKGALLECQHAVKTGETLHVVRLDTNRQAQARVAWHRRRESGRHEIGIQFLDCENFWELDWSSAELSESGSL